VETALFILSPENENDIQVYSSYTTFLKIFIIEAKDFTSFNKTEDLKTEDNHLTFK
jgi:hypothetical protein